MEADSIHRQRNHDYINELESEVLRLRSAEGVLNARVKELEGSLPQASLRPACIAPRNELALRIMMGRWNGQIAPGLFITPLEAEIQMPSLRDSSAINGE